MIERMNQAPQPQFLGDEIIPNPAVDWTTRVDVPRDPAEVWKHLSCIGLLNEPSGADGAGWLVPQVIEKELPPALHSVAPEDRLRRRVGDTLRDFPPDSSAEVVLMDGLRRALVLDSVWPPSPKRPNGMHYTWEAGVDENPEGGSTLYTRMRIEEHRRPRLLRVVGARLDQWGMNMVGRGLTERIPPGDNQEQAVPSRVDTFIAASIGGVATGARLLRRLRGMPEGAS